MLDCLAASGTADLEIWQSSHSTARMQSIAMFQGHLARGNLLGPYLRALCGLCDLFL